MDSDRKYRQHGYMDSAGPQDGQSSRDGKPKPKGPKPPLDITGPRLPRLVDTVTASRCYSCATALPADIDFTGNCPKCNAALHCCKQCSWFEPFDPLPVHQTDPRADCREGRRQPVRVLPRPRDSGTG